MSLAYHRCIMRAGAVRFPLFMSRLRHPLLAESGRRRASPRALSVSANPLFFPAWLSRPHARLHSARAGFVIASPVHQSPCARSNGGSLAGDGRRSRYAAAVIAWGKVRRLRSFGVGASPLQLCPALCRRLRYGAYNIAGHRQETGGKHLRFHASKGVSYENYAAAAAIKTSHSVSCFNQFSV